MQTKIESIKIDSQNPISFTVNLSDDDALGSKLKVILTFHIDTTIGNNPQNVVREVFIDEKIIDGRTVSFSVNDQTNNYYNYEGKAINMYFSLKYIITEKDNQTIDEIKFPALGGKPSEEGEDVTAVYFADQIKDRSLLAMVKNLPLSNRISFIIYSVLGCISLVFLLYWFLFDAADIESKMHYISMYLMVYILFFAVLITSSLRETYKVAKFVLNKALISETTKIPLNQIFTAKYKTVLKDVYIRVIAENEEIASYKTKKDNLFDGQSNPVLTECKKIRSALLFEKKVDLIKAGEKIENYFTEEIEFKKIFQKLYTPCLIDDVGISIKLYVEIMTPTTQPLILVDYNKNVFNFQTNNKTTRTPFLAE